MEKKNNNQPFFMDVTLRDGNQALKNPWNLEEKKQVFRILLGLGVQGIEAGFAAASVTDFQACQELSEECPSGVVISSLSRAVKSEITKSWEALRQAPDPRIHIVLPSSRFTVENVLHVDQKKAMTMAYESVSFAREIMRGRGTVQFSLEHFGECYDELSYPVAIMQEAIRAGAHVINLPNTVERFRPFHFVRMVEEVKKMIPENVVLSVHNHNDLGMATATTVESYFAGATQLEVSLNGLGERAGNTNLYEVACVLHNNGIKVPLIFSEFYSSAQKIAFLSGISIHEKAPLIGEDVVYHRSGIHQDGVEKTMNKGKGAYRAFDYTLIGREEMDLLEFTSQSGKTAVKSILGREGIEISIAEAEKIQPVFKELSEKKGTSLTSKEMAEFYYKIEVA